MFLFSVQILQAISLFVGIEVPVDVQKQVHNLQARINRGTRRGLITKFYKLKELHISLVSIGDVEEKYLIEYKKALKEATMISNAFSLKEELNTSTFTFFGVEKTIAAFELTENVILTSLVHRIRNSFKKRGLSYDKRFATYRAHLSIGRAKKRRHKYFKRKFNPPRTKEFNVSRIFLNIRDKGKEEKVYFSLEGLSLSRLQKRVEQLTIIIDNLAERIVKLERHRRKK